MTTVLSEFPNASKKKTEPCFLVSGKLFLQLYKKLHYRANFIHQSKKNNRIDSELLLSFYPCFTLPQWTSREQDIYFFKKKKKTLFPFKQKARDGIRTYTTIHRNRKECDHEEGRTKQTPKFRIHINKLETLTNWRKGKDLYLVWIKGFGLASEEKEERKDHERRQKNSAIHRRQSTLRFECTLLSYFFILPISFLDFASRLPGAALYREPRRIQALAASR